jgi:hypothetical protein
MRTSDIVCNVSYYRFNQVGPDPSKYPLPPSILHRDEQDYLLRKISSYGYELHI